nr:hypothetical protein [Tanacetum cinerariifolium]
MALTFADTHNMIAFLTKSDASEGFKKIIDFLNTSVIQYALMVNPTIYVSCIKQFWSSISLKKTNDVVRLQALIDRRKVIINGDTVRQALRLDDADSIDCLPNEEITVELARMGYEKPSTKLTFYKAFFSAQWKLLIHTILQCMSAKRTVWNEFISSMASAVICLATGRKFNISKYIIDSLVRNVDSPSKFYMVGKGFSGVNTSLFDGMLVPHQVHDDFVDAAENEDAANEISADPTPPSPTPATIPPPQQELIPLPSQVESTLPPSPHQSPITQPSSPPSQQPFQPEGIFHSAMALLNQLLKTCATLTKKIGNLEQNKIAQAIEITKLKQRVGSVESSADTIMDDQEDASKQGGIAELDANEDITLETVDVQGRLPESQAQVYHLDLEHAQKVLSMQGTDEAEPAEASAARRRRGVIIQDPEEAATASLSVQSERKEKKDIKEEESKESKRKCESSKQKAAKKKRINEEVDELKTHLQIVPNTEDDVYTEATPLASNVPVVNYQIHIEHNKPYYKIIIANGTHQLFLSFISLLRNFEREDIEMLWKIF